MGKKKALAMLLSIVMIATVLLTGMASVLAAGKLSAPKTEISIKASTGKPMLKWEPVEGAEKYEIYRAASKNGTYTRMYTQKSMTYTNTTAVVGKTYYYKVRAVDAEGNKGEFSAVKHITCDCARPSVTVSVNVSSGKPKLKWNAVEGASKYEIWRATAKNGTYAKFYTTSGTSYTNTTAVEGKTYYYKVKALCKATSYGDSAFSEIKSAKCEDVTLKYTISANASTGKPTLQWDSVPGAAKYEIWRAASKNGTYSRMYTQKSTTYTNTTAAAGKTYYYKVRALDAAGNKGEFSAVKSITCDCARPVVSAKLSASGKPQLTWKAVDGASKYEVYRAVSKNGTYYKYYTLTGTTYTNTTATAGKTYYYKVKALCKATSYGDSAFSEVKSVACEANDGVIGTAVCLANEWMNLRSGPGTSYEKSGTLAGGAVVNVYEIDGIWHKIMLDGKYHWASGDYLSVTLKGETESEGKYDGFPIAENSRLKGKVIFLDPGHGGGGGGAYGDYEEHEYNLKHAKLIRESLENSGATVIMTRTSDTHVDNYARVSMANKYTLEILKSDKQKQYDSLAESDSASDEKLDALLDEIAEIDRLIGVMQSVINKPELAETYYLSPYEAAVGRAAHKDIEKIFELQKNSLLDHIIYVSIHSNATGDGGTSANGTVTFYMDNEMNPEYYTGYQTAKNKKLATELCNEVAAAGGYAKRGVKVNDYFMVREVNIPSALLEIGFHTNAGDREKLMDPAVQKRVANAVTFAIMDYFG